MSSPTSYLHYVDIKKGLVSRELFVNDQLYRDELERIYTRAWLFVGHESQIANPDDFFASRMGAESVILCRDKTNQIHVFLNTCRHRGVRVCLYDEGNTPQFTCPYHSWSYGTDGTLQGVPKYQELYEGCLDKSEWPLIEVAKLTSYKGTIWATWDREAPDFIAYLGGAKEHLDMALDCRDGREGGSEVIGGITKWIFPSNWKLPVENFMGDTYHNPSHKSVDLIGIGPSGKSDVKGRRDSELDKAQHLWINFPEGHGVHSAIMPEDWEYTESFKDSPAVEQYFRHCHEERHRRMGDRHRLLPFVGSIFPNTSYHGRQPRSLFVWHPHGPTTTEVWRFFLVDKDAPAEVKDFVRHYYMRYSGPAGMTEQDDMENWNYSTAASQGTIARRYPYNYQQSLHASRLNDPIPGRVSLQMSEDNPRALYRRWADYMAGKSWDELLGKGDPRYAAARSG